MKNSALFDREKLDSFQLEVIYLSYRIKTVFFFDVSILNRLLMFRNIFQVSAVEARPSLITKMKEKDKANYPTNKIQITINVDDDNDNSPAFSPSKIHYLPKCSNQMLPN